MRVISLAAAITWSAILLAETQHGGTNVGAAAPPCNNYLSEVTPPENIGVAITNASGNVVGVSYVDFKSYVKDVLPNEWLPNWQMAAYQAGALAVKGYGWYYVNHWDGDVYLPTGQCWHVRDDTFDQVYIAGSATAPTAYAVEQTWNWLLQSGGAIYPTYYKAGCPVNTPGIFTNCQGRTDQCGQWYLGAAPGNDMSQYGSQSCAIAGWTWAQIVNAYYFDGGGGHTYGQWHAAMGYGPLWWTGLSVSGGSWKFMSSSGQCASPTTLGYGNPSDIKFVGDWDGNGTYTPGVVRLSGNAFTWYLRNAPGGGSADVTPFAYGQYGDIPVVGDWDGNGTWTPGVVRGNQWYMRNYNSAGGHNILASYGDGGDTPLPGKWKTQSANQPMTLGIVRFDPIGTLHFYQRFSNTSGTADRHFTYGNYTDRPIAGDWNSSDNSTHFGPGIVRDDASDYCRTPPMNQGWYLRYTNDPGVANMSFRYDVIRP